MLLFRYFVWISSIASIIGCSNPSDEPADVPGVNEPVVPDNPDKDIVSPVPSFTCVTTSTAVDVSRRYQKMEGFGASDCWLPNLIGEYWTSNRGDIARWLFSRDIIDGQPQGIGLSMWRVNLGAGTSEIGISSGIDNDNAFNRAESYLDRNGNYDWNKCAGQRYFMEQALNNGCESFILFSNSPLVQWTKNGQGRSDSGSHANLKNDCYDDFARYMADVAAHFNAVGYNVSHISPVNEPQWNWDGHSQEGSGWKNSEVAKLVRELDAAIKGRNIPTKILIGEAGQWNHLYEGDPDDRTSTVKAFFDPLSSSYIGNLECVDNIISGHSYWTFDNWNDMRAVRSKVGQSVDGLDVRVWQTEWSMLDAIPSELGTDYDSTSEFDISTYMSKVIHLDVTCAESCSWSYWTAMAVERWGQKNRFELVKTTPVGGHYNNDFTLGGSVEPTHNLWVLGNYSRFVRPGYTRIHLDLNGKENKNFFGTAYVSPDNNRIVVVITNLNKKLGITFDNTFTGIGNPVAVFTYTTTETKHLQEARFNPRDKVFVEPNSVTTVVYDF